MLTVLRQQMLEVVQIEALVVLGLLCKGHEEADKEDGDYKDEEAKSPLESGSNALSGRLLAVLSRVLVVFLVPEVGEGNDEEAEHCVEGVQGVVDDAQRVQDAVDLFGRGPVLLAPQAGSRRGRDEGDIDGDEQNGGEQRKGGEDADNGDGSGAITGLLVYIDEGRGDEKEQADGNGICYPNKALLDERHGCPRAGGLGGVSIVSIVPVVRVGGFVMEGTWSRAACFPAGRWRSYCDGAMTLASSGERG